MIFFGVNGTIGCVQKSFMLVWRCHQLPSGFLAKGHLQRVSRQSRRSLMIRMIMKWTKSWPRHEYVERKTGILPHYCFPWKDLKLYVKKEEDEKIIVMEDFNSIIFHKSWSASNQLTNQRIVRKIVNKVYKTRSEQK